MALRDEIDNLARVAPAARVAAAVLLVGAGLRPVPVNPETVAASAGPLADLQSVLDHFWARPGDGVGLATGPTESGDVLVAVRSTPAGWRDWLRTVAVITTEHEDGDGRLGVYERTLEIPPPCVARWHPAEPVRVRTAVAFGRQELEDAGRALDSRNAPTGPALPTWSEARLWRIAVPAGQRLTVKGRTLHSGVELVAGGEVVPLWLRRGCWQLSFTSLPAVEAAVDWFVAARGGTWKAVAA